MREVKGGVGGDYNRTEGKKKASWGGGVYFPREKKRLLV